jgi:hypothetical protein
VASFKIDKRKQSENDNLFLHYFLCCRSILRGAHGEEPTSLAQKNLPKVALRLRAREPWYTSASTNDATVKTPPTIAHRLVRKWASEGRVSLYCTVMGDKSYLGVGRGDQQHNELSTLCLHEEHAWQAVACLIAQVALMLCHAVLIGADHIGRAKGLVASGHHFDVVPERTSALVRTCGNHSRGACLTETDGTQRWSVLW